MITLRVVNDMEKVSRLMEQMFCGVDSRFCLHGHSLAPQLDIYETADHFLVAAELAGVASEDVEVVVDRIHLRLSGKRRQADPTEAFRVHQSEISYGDFSRVFRMPCAIDPEGVEAAMENGMLRIKLPKAPSCPALIEIRDQTA
ncbi:MAG: Hsp20/alpha crystallin family protein [Pseudomonadota bacterium]